MQLITVPESGIDHPVFEHLQQDEALDMMFTFGFLLDEDALEVLKKLFSVWVAKTDWEACGGRPIFITEMFSNCLHLAITGVPTLQKPIRLLIYELSRSPLALESVFLVARKMDGNGKMQQVLTDPSMPPVQLYEDKTAWWNASFSPDLTNPVTEVVELSMAYTEDGKAKVREKRGMPLYLEGCRIVYGKVGAPIFSPNKYCASIAGLMKELLHKFFPDCAPTLYNKHGFDDYVDLLLYERRLGYRFRFKPEHLVVSYPKNFRFREYELMLALREAIQRLHLAPVIHWKRNDWYEVNLWENWQYDVDLEEPPFNE